MSLGIAGKFPLEKHGLMPAGHNGCPSSVRLKKGSSVLTSTHIHTHTHTHTRKWTPDLFADTEPSLSHPPVVPFRDHPRRYETSICRPFRQDHYDQRSVTNAFSLFPFHLFYPFFSPPLFFLAEATYFMICRANETIAK